MDQEIRDAILLLAEKRNPEKVEDSGLAGIHLGRIEIESKFGEGKGKEMQKETTPLLAQ